MKTSELEDLYTAHENLLNLYNAILKRTIDCGIDNTKLKCCIDSIPRLADIDLDWFAEIVTEYNINDHDAVLLLFRDTDTLNWLLRSKEHYNKWKNVSQKFINNYGRLSDYDRDIVSSYLDSGDFSISVQDILDYYVGDMSIKMFVDSYLPDQVKSLLSSYDFPIDYDICFKFLSDYPRYTIVEIDNNCIRVFDMAY